MQVTNEKLGQKRQQSAFTCHSYADLSPKADSKPGAAHVHQTTLYSYTKENKVCTIRYLKVVYVCVFTVRLTWISYWSSAGLPSGLEGGRG